MRFLLRQYPIRSQAHGTRKVFSDRRARLDPEERALGWHVQYEALDQSQFRRGLSGADRVRRRRRPSSPDSASPSGGTTKNLLDQQSERLNSIEEAHAALREEHSTLSAQLDELTQRRAELTGQLTDERRRAADAESHAGHLLEWIRQLEGAAREAHARLDAVHQSITWRWTKPIRLLARPFRPIDR